MPYLEIPFVYMDLSYFSTSIWADPSGPMCMIKLFISLKDDEGIPLTEGKLEDDEQLDEIEVNQSKHDFQSPKLKNSFLWLLPS